MYPKNIELIVNDNIHEPYIGFMWKHTYPKIGDEFLVHSSKLRYIFKTSIITEIIERSDIKIVFKDENNSYTINL